MSPAVVSVRLSVGLHQFLSSSSIVLSLVQIKRVVPLSFVGLRPSLRVYSTRVSPVALESTFASLSLA